MICKKCNHPDYTHHEATGKCDASITKLIREYDDVMYGFPFHAVEAEVLGECDCNG